MSTLYVDTITEKTSGNGVQIPGHVVGYNYGTTTSQTTTSSTTFISIGLSVSYAAKATNSLLVIRWVTPTELDDSSANSEDVAQTTLYVDGSAQDATDIAFLSMQNLRRVGSDMTHTMVLTASDTASHTYAIYGNVNADTVVFGRYGRRSLIEIMEIAQ